MSVESVVLTEPPLDTMETAPGLLAASSPAVADKAPRDLTGKLVGVTSALTAGMVVERSAGFLANLLAARLAGASTFGAYALAISTANNISSYAAGGIGATAARFSGKYPRGSAGYATLGRVLVVVSLFSAALAMSALWLGAAPIATLLHKPALTGLLRWAALSAAGIILLECARGFFVGQRRLTAIVLLSGLVGTGMLTLVPVAAHLHSAVGMVAFQGCVTTSAVLLCMLLSGPLHLHAPSRLRGLPAVPMLREVWGFGLVQLAGLVGANLAGWFLTMLIARGDTTLVQMSFFAVASQLRNVVGIVPGLFTESSYAVMAEADGDTSQTPHRVLALCSFASSAVAMLLAAVGMVFVPWLLLLLYGKAYAQAGATVALALATAVMHMGNAPAAARLTILSIRATGVINSVWAVFVALAGFVFLLLRHPGQTAGGGATTAMAIYFAGHVLSSALVLLTLARKGGVPAGMPALYLLTGSLAATLGGLALLRAAHPGMALVLTAAMLVVAVAGGTSLSLLARRHGWLPSRNAWQAVLARLPLRRARHV